MDPPRVVGEDLADGRINRGAHSSPLPLFAGGL